MLEDARNFLKEKQLYYDLGIKWKRTYLLEGVPGTGKTSLASAVAGELQCVGFTARARACLGVTGLLACGSC